MAHLFSHRSMHDAERRLDIATAETSAAQATARHAADDLVRSGRERGAELRRVVEETQTRLKQQDERREERRRNGSIETAIEALNAIGRPH